MTERTVDKAALRLRDQALKEQIDAFVADSELVVAGPERADARNQQAMFVVVRECGEDLGFSRGMYRPRV